MRKDRSGRRHASASDPQRDRPPLSEVTAPSISRSSACLSEVKGPQLLLKRHTLLFGDRLDAISSWSDLSGGRVPAPPHQTAGKASAAPTPSSPCGQLLQFILLFFLHLLHVKRNLQTRPCRRPQGRVTPDDPWTSSGHRMLVRLPSRSQTWGTPAGW